VPGFFLFASAAAALAGFEWRQNFSPSCTPGLATEFPHNQLYSKELARIQ